MEGRSQKHFTSRCSEKEQVYFYLTWQGRAHGGFKEEWWKNAPYIRYNYTRRIIDCTNVTHLRDSCRPSHLRDERLNGFTSGIPIHQRVLQIKDLSSGVNPLHTPANTASFQGTPTEVLGICAKNLTCWSVGCCWEGNTCTWDTHEAPPLQPLSPHLCSEDHLEHRNLIDVYKIRCLRLNQCHISQVTMGCPVLLTWAPLEYTALKPIDL